MLGGKPVHKYRKFLKLTGIGTLMSVLGYISLMLYTKKILAIDLNEVTNPQVWLVLYFVILAIWGLAIIFTICMIFAYFITKHKEIKEYGKRYYDGM